MKRSTLPFLLFLVLAAAVLRSGSAARAQDGAIVRLIPVVQNENAFTVDVVAENVTDLYGLEFYLTYDPAVLNVVDNNPEQGGTQIEPGTLSRSRQVLLSLIRSIRPPAGYLMP